MLVISSVDLAPGKHWVNRTCGDPRERGENQVFDPTSLRVTPDEAGGLGGC